MSWPEGYDLIARDRVDSTSLELRRLVSNLTKPTWMIAETQTAPKGRRGRAWTHPAGNFAASLLLRPKEDKSLWALRSFTAALALHHALVELTDLPESYGLKWPNDVLLNGGKVAGILLEAADDDTLILGIGVNLIVAPGAEHVEPKAVRPVSVLAETGKCLSPRVLLEHVAAHFAALETALTTEGFAPIRAAWLSHAARIGAEIQVRLPNQTLSGIFTTIDSDGQLVLSGTDETRHIAAGDVFF